MINNNLHSIFYFTEFNEKSFVDYGTRIPIFSYNILIILLLYIQLQ